MIAKKQLKFEIDQLDDRYIELLYKIIRQFPRIPDKSCEINTGEAAANIFKEIADNGGLGISDPIAWQREIRKDRALPFRNDDVT
jgi:hypothetical protein